MDATPELNPYAAPKSSEVPRSSRPPDGRARFARTLLLAQVPLQLLATLLYVVRLSTGADMRRIDSSTWAGAATGLVLWISGLLELVTIVVFLSWLRASYVRATAVIRDARHSPTDSVAAWFIPIINLWLPFMVMKELWQLSRGGTAWRETSPPRYITAWWMSYLVWLGAALASFVIGFGNKVPWTPAHRVFSGALSVMLSALTLCALFWAVRFVREIDAMQREGSRRD